MWSTKTFSAKVPCFCRPPQRSGLVCTLWLFMEVWCSSACSCCMTRRRSLSEQRRTPFMVFRSMTLSTRKWLEWARTGKCWNFVTCAVCRDLDLNSVFYKINIFLTVMCGFALPLILQVYGHLHGHTQYLHAAGDDSSQWWRKQEKVAIMRREAEWICWFCLNTEETSD